MDQTAQTAETLEPINRRVQMMLDAMPARVWFLDRDHHTLYANREAAKLIGKPADALVGVPTADLIGEASFRADLPMRLRALAGEATKWEGWSVYADGVRRYTERVFHPHFEIDGAITGYYEFVRDFTEQKRAEAEKLHSEQLLKDAIDSLTDGFAVMNSEGVLVACNAAYAALSGAEPAELLGRGFRDRAARLVRQLVSVDGAPFDNAAPDAVARFDAIRLSSEKPVELGLKDGRLLLARRATTFDGGRALLLSDVTELKRREVELEEARAHLEEAVAALSIGFAIYDCDRRLMMCNQRYRDFNPEIAGLLRPGALFDDLLREGARRGQYPDEPDGESYVERRVRELSEPGVNPVVRQAGDRWYRVWYQAIRGGGMVLLQTDITETLRMETELRKSEELVRQVLEACPYPITMSRAEDSVVIYETPAAQQLFGHAEPREGRSSAERWLKEKNRARYVRRLRATGAVDDMEVRFLRESGEVFWAAVSGRLIRYRGEEVIVSCVFDLTERRAAEAELERHREALHQAEKLSALGELLAGVSHELNNPLSVLVGQAAMLSEEADDPETMARAKKISAAAERCARIVKSFLTMARRQASALALCDSGALIRDALEACEPMLRSAAIEVTLDLAPEAPQIPADAAQIRQVLINLIVNAQQALQQVARARRIDIATRIEEETLVVEIADNGPGVPETLRSRVFEPLFTTKEVGVGTGIGLALCHRIVAGHGGRIRVDGGDDGGAVFTVTLPIRRSAAAPDKADAASAERKLRVLVVDDDPDVLEIVADVIERHGHRVEAAAGAREALGKLEYAPYDAVISDVRMPDMDGPAFFAALLERRPEVVERLGFMTGDAMSGGVGAFLRAAGRPHVEKPVTPDELRRLLAELTRKSASEAEDAP